MAQQLPERRNEHMIHIHHENEGAQNYLCLNCCGVETVILPNDREKVWKHLEEFHDWPSKNKEMLHVWETFKGKNMAEKINDL